MTLGKGSTLFRYAPHAALIVVLFAVSACGSPDAAAPLTAGAASPTATSAAVATGAATPAKTAPPRVRVLGYPEGVDAKKDIARAVAAARNDGGRVLLDFGATWCVDCRVVEKFWDDARVAPIVDASYHVVSIDVGEFDRNMDLFERYAPTATGIPTFVLLDSKGKKVKDSGKSYVTASTDKTAADFARLLTSWAGPAA